jgi:flagellum-specific peptidoglycan hydrolase FlgJ
MISFQKKKETGKTKCRVIGFAAVPDSMHVLLPVIYLIFAAFFVHDTQATERSAQAYVRTYKAIALSKSNEYSIPYKVILGIAIVESGSGQSRTARELNNHFGIVGQNSLKRKTRYRQYGDVKESYDHFCRVLTRKTFYSSLKSTRNHELWIRAISRTGYSEMPSIWEKRVLGVIEDIKTL